MSDVDVIAQRGQSVLIRVDAEHARILDMRHGRLFAAQRVETALARGYWKPFAGSLDDVATALGTAEEMDDEATGTLGPAPRDTVV